MLLLAALPYPTKHLQREVNISESKDAPAGEGGFVVFFDVGDEPGTAVVAALDPDAAFDFNQCA